MRIVEIEVSVEVGDVEREARLKYACYEAEKQTRDCPGYPAYAEYLSGYFVDSGDDAEDFVDADAYEEEALEKADEEAEVERDAAIEAAIQRRRDRE